MKKLFFIALAVSLVLGSCKKFEFDEVDNNPDPVPVPNINYNWPGYPIPKPVENLERTYVGVSVNGINIYDYKFRMHLDGSQVDPNPLTAESFSIPHVGPGGVLIYVNVNNDATYTVNYVEGGFVYYTIRSEVGHTLKYNMAKKIGGNNIWFLRYGLSSDDGNNNIITFNTY